MDLTAVEHPGAIVFRPDFSRLDASAAPAFRQALLAKATGKPVVVIDMSNVKFVDSSGLGSLVSILKVLPPGGHLRLVAVSESVLVLLRVTRLNRIFPCFASVPDALTA